MEGQEGDVAAPCATSHRAALRVPRDRRKISGCHEGFIHLQGEPLVGSLVSCFARSRARLLPNAVSGGGGGGWGWVSGHRAGSSRSMPLDTLSGKFFFSSCAAAKPPSKKMTTFLAAGASPSTPSRPRSSNSSSLRPRRARAVPSSPAKQAPRPAVSSTSGTAKGRVRRSKVVEERGFGRGGEISIFGTQFVRLSRFDIQLVSLSKFDTGHTNCFNLRDFSFFFSFSNSNISWTLFTGGEMTTLPITWETKKRLERVGLFLQSSSRHVGVATRPLPSDGPAPPHLPAPTLATAGYRSRRLAPAISSAGAHPHRAADAQQSSPAPARLELGFGPLLQRRAGGLRPASVAISRLDEGVLHRLHRLMAPPGIDPDPDGTFRLCVQFSQFRAKLNNGSSVDVPRSLFKWDADYRCYNLEMLHKDLEAKVIWGSGQQLVIHAFDMSGGGERKLVDDVELALAFSDRMDDKKLFLFVDIVDKPSEVFCSSAIIEAAVSNVHDNAVGEEDGNQEAFVSSLIDWDSLEIAPIAEEQIGAAFPVMSEEAMYEFVGLRAEDERAEQARIAAEQAANLDDLELQDGELLVDDDVPGENSVLYDKENPPMTVGTIYASMDEFRAAVRQHGIMGQFELGTEKSCKKVFRGYCKAEDCPWSIVARLMQDEQQVRITLNKGQHFCASTGRVRTKMATYHWVAEKAIPLLKKDPNMGTKKIQRELEDKYQVKIGYSTVHLGKEKAAQQIFGTWEESFGYLFNFKAEIELKMPGSVVEIDVVHKEEGVYFHRFFCCLKPSIDGFLNGCRPFLSVDSTALNGRWNGHMPSATALDGHNWMFPVAFGFFDGETTENWTWFMQQLQKAIGNPPHLAISSDANKGIENAVKKVYPWAEHRECFFHLMKNFKKKFQGPAFGRMYPAARTFQLEYHEYLMNKMYAVNKQVEPWLKTNHKLKWMRSKFLEEIKCDHITSNVAEVWNNWVKEIKDLPIADLADTLRSKFMELYARRRRIGEKFEGHVMLPVVVRQLYALSRQLGHLNLKEGGREEAEVTEITASHKVIRHVVNIQNHTCTCREWQVSGKPCGHALLLITTCRNPKMEEYLHPYYSVYHFRLAYGGVIKPLPDKSQWVRVDPGFKVLPPLNKRDVGRQWKNRKPSCIENKGSKPARGKGMWQVKCKNCLGLGHRTTSPKCPLNGTKKRKSRAKKGKAGRPAGCTKGDATPSPSKRQKVSVQENLVNSSPGPLALTMATQMNNSPGPVTRSQMHGGINKMTTSPRAVTRSQTGEGPSDAVSTPKRRLPVKKKLTPKKRKNNDV